MQVLPLQLQVVESLRGFLRQARTSFDNGHDEHVEKLITFGVSATIWDNKPYMCVPFLLEIS